MLKGLTKTLQVVLHLFSVAWFLFDPSWR